MRFARNDQGAEVTELIAGLGVVLAAGVVALNIMFGGLQGAATNIKNWITAITIAAPKTS